MFNIFYTLTILIFLTERTVANINCNVPGVTLRERQGFFNFYLKNVMFLANTQKKFFFFNHS